MDSVGMLRTEGWLLSGWSAQNMNEIAVDWDMGYCLLRISIVA